jgi:oligopeptide transport system ATP-binding protein
VATRDQILRVTELRKHFPVFGGLLQRPVALNYAVDGVTFSVRKGETFGLVGESGCGKTTVGRLILRLIPATSGNVIFQGQDVFGLSGSSIRRLRREMQMIFQDPYASLNPRMSVGQIVGEFLEVHRLTRGRSTHARVKDLLGLVGLQPVDALRYPHEFSGGQRQRIGIARALALSPKLIICDEPVSALDVSIQSQILNLLDELQHTLGLTYVFIAHGLHVVKHVSNRIGVMYLGKLVEVAPSQALFAGPCHPYTQALISAIPVPNPEITGSRIVLEGDVPSPIRPPSGCRFHTRCRHVVGRCREEEPALLQVGEDHLVACHLSGGASAGRPPQPHVSP